MNMCATRAALLRRIMQRNDVWHSTKHHSPRIKGMSPTLLEALMVIIILVVAWQIGLTLAPLIFREWRNMRRSLDEVSHDIEAEQTADQQTKEQYPHDPQR